MNVENDKNDKNDKNDIILSEKVSVIYLFDNDKKLYDNYNTHLSIDYSINYSILESLDVVLENGFIEVEYRKKPTYVSSCEEMISFFFYE